MGLLLAAVSARGAEGVLSDGPEWPNVVVDEPQWPNVKLDDVEALRVNPSPAFLDPVQVENRILGRKPATAPAANAVSKMEQAAAISANASEVEAPAARRAGRPCRLKKYLRLSSSKAAPATGIRAAR
jgi:hypothetical protein